MFSQIVTNFGVRIQTKSCTYSFEISKHENDGKIPLGTQGKITTRDIQK
jgi:hypothetical protein